MLTVTPKEDEERILAKSSQESRRWSHVFHSGEIEFKRRSGPNWKSLCQPAILPITIDYIDDLSKVPSTPVNVATLGSSDEAYRYESFSDLLVEMVKQRLIKDYQVVHLKADDTVKTRAYDDRSLRLGKKLSSKKMTLSLGNTTQILTEKSNEIKVQIYNNTSSKDNTTTVYNEDYPYSYMLWLPSTKSYGKVTIVFKKFTEQLGWSDFDNILTGVDRVLTEKHKYRRISFRVVPMDYKIPGRGEEKLEKIYTEKMEKLISYLSKNLIKNDVKVTFQTRSDNPPNTESSKWYKVMIDKKKTTNLEWMQIKVDSVYHTERTFGIVFAWLVASAHNIETIINLVQRRCLDYGLELICVPQASLSGSMYLNPFLRPEVVEIKCSTETKYDEIESSLYQQFDFVNDGVRRIEKEDVKDYLGNDLEVFGFCNRGRNEVYAQQYMHLSGVMFIRLHRKKDGTALYLFLENRKLQTLRNIETIPDTEVIFRTVKDFIVSKSES